MLLDEKPLDGLTIDDVNQLIKEGICESPRNDYKREWWGSTDKARREMLRDISAFANSYGGYIVVGIETEQGAGPGDMECPCSVNGIERSDYTQMILRSCRDSFDPPCNGIQTTQIEADQGHIVLLIKVPQSLDAPHMVTFKGLNQFWQRHGTDKQPMSTQEIRELFTSRLSYQDQVFRLAQERLSSLAGEDRNLLYMWAAPVVPLRAQVDVKSRELKGLFGDTLLNLPYGADLYSGAPRPCLDGIETDVFGSGSHQFIRLRRDGFLEFGTERTLLDDQSIHAFTVSAFLENFSSLVTNVYGKLEAGPVALGCSLVNVDGYRLFVGSFGQFESISRAHWEGAILDLRHEVAYDFEAEKTVILRGISDRLWNAFHYDDCPFYRTGELVPPR